MIKGKNLVFSALLCTLLVGCGGGGGGGDSSGDDSNSGASSKATIAGTLDTNFQNTGYVTKDIGSVGKDIATAMVIDGSDNIYFGGTSNDNKVIVGRYTKAGELDSGFNSDGLVSLEYNASDSGERMNIRDMILGSSSSKVYVAGTLKDLSPPAGTPIKDLMIMKFNTDGTLDTSFSGDGIFLDGTFSTGSDTEAFGIAQDSDENIYVAGYRRMETNLGGRNMSIWKMNSNGVLDTNFGDNGRVSDNIATNWIPGRDDSANDIAVHDNYVYTVGYGDDGNRSTGTGIIWRYNKSNGTLDKYFNYDSSTDSGGRVLYTNNNGYLKFQSIYVTSNGSVFVAGLHENEDGNYVPIVLKYHSDGTADTDFGGGDGVVTISSSDGDVYDIQVDSRGNIYVVGGNANSSNNNYQMTVYRLTSSGELDTTFGSSGVFTHQISSFETVGMALRFDSEGYPFIVGYSSENNYDIALWKLK